MAQHSRYNTTYTGDRLNRIAFPLGGIGAGMICIEGSGAFSHVSLRHRPEVFNEPVLFAAVAVKGASARVLEGPVPSWKLFGPAGSGNGGSGKHYGLPRFAKATFTTRFPFAEISLADRAIPLAVTVTAWSPFTPGDADSSSLPVAAVEYRFTNRTGKRIDAVFSFHARNFMAPAANSPGQEVVAITDGFVLWQAGTAEKPADHGAFSACVDAASAKVNPVWFRGGWFDALTMVWRSIAAAAMPTAMQVGQDMPSPGGSIYVPFSLKAKQSRTIRVRLAWRVPASELRQGRDPDVKPDCGCPPMAGCDSGPEDGPARQVGGHSDEFYSPWYASRFKRIAEVIDYWRRNYADLRRRSARFADCFYDTTLPAEVVEAVAANLTILKSPTVLRQADGRLWAWEGCSDSAGCCPGSCTHVWNYAQAMPHLFADLERSLRQTEFGENQDERGHQAFRAALPIRPVVHDFHAAADGQLGGIMKVYREWRISGDTAWLRGLWPRVKASLDYAIATWDPDRQGLVCQPHHNTYDIEFWGPDGMCTSFYLGALVAAARMARALGCPEDATGYDSLYAAGRQAMETELFNGEYFVQRVQWQGLAARQPGSDPSTEAKPDSSPELAALLRSEGPRYQYGSGCLSDGVLGAWMAEVCGLGEILDPDKVASHLRAVRRHNFKAARDLSAYANPQRPTYALGAAHEAGLLLCTWPRGGEPSLPFVYSNEVWTGIEYQVASHLMMAGFVEGRRQGLGIVRAVRDRYDGRVRNPFNEYECGHWYARAMSSYALLQGLTGARYDAVDETLYLKVAGQPAPAMASDFRAFLCTPTGFGTVGVHRGKPFFEVRSGKVRISRIVLAAR